MPQGKGSSPNSVLGRPAMLLVPAFSRLRPPPPPGLPSTGRHLLTASEMDLALPWRLSLILSQSDSRPFSGWESNAMRHSLVQRYLVVVVWSPDSDSRRVRLGRLRLPQDPSARLLVHDNSLASPPSLYLFAAATPIPSDRRSTRGHPDPQSLCPLAVEAAKHWRFQDPAHTGGRHLRSPRSMFPLFPRFIYLLTENCTVFTSSRVTMSSHEHPSPASTTPQAPCPAS